MLDKVHYVIRKNIISYSAENAIQKIYEKDIRGSGVTMLK